MASMSCNKAIKIAIIFTSVSGNTEEVAAIIHSLVGGDCFHVNSFNLTSLETYDAVLVGSYTWGRGELPAEMIPLYEAFESQDVQHLVTGIFGTGDSMYADFCGAVDILRDMLAVHTDLTVTLKVEQMPQSSDIVKCQKFVERIWEKLDKKMVKI